MKSAGPVLELARAHGVEMPITEVVAGVTHGRIGMAEAVMLLASRSAKPERYGSDLRAARGHAARGEPH